MVYKIFLVPRRHFYRDTVHKEVLVNDNGKSSVNTENKSCASIFFFKWYEKAE